MAKGDDAVRRRRNKVSRKRMRNSESVSARVASIIASKRRRKVGKRRICEGMCFSLPTAEDPFNDRFDKKALASRNKPKLKHKKPPSRQADGKESQKRLPPSDKGTSEDKKLQRPNMEHPPGGKGDGTEDGRISKFLFLCLNAIQDAWAGDGTFDVSVDAPLLASKWGLEFWRCCSAGSNVVDMSGACATREQIAWLVSMASDVIARKEKQGIDILCPFLLYLVPSREKAIQVRSVCKPLKALGIHTVSLHAEALLDHQICGLKSCEPEFLIATPERLLELVSLKAIEISGVTLMVLDGVKNFLDFGFMDKLKSIREKICRDPQMVAFSFCNGDISAMQILLNGPVCKLYSNDSIISQSAFISQQANASDEEKTSK